jgi:hypothetical protein
MTQMSHKVPWRVTRNHDITSAGSFLSDRSLAAALERSSAHLKAYGLDSFPPVGLRCSEARVREC